MVPHGFEFYILFIYIKCCFMKSYVMFSQVCAIFSEDCCLLFWACSTGHIFGMLTHMNIGDYNICHVWDLNKLD